MQEAQDITELPQRAAGIGGWNTCRKGSTTRLMCQQSGTAGYTTSPSALETTRRGTERGTRRIFPDKKYISLCGFIICFVFFLCNYFCWFLLRFAWTLLRQCTAPN